MKQHYKPRIVHMASKMSSKGGVSPLCAIKPRAINMKISSWTLTRAAVTCTRCQAKLKELKAA